MVGLSGGPGGAGPLFYVAHALAPTSTFSLAHWGEIMEAAVDSLATGTRGGFYYFLAGSVAMYCRQQRYPSPRLISYKIPPIPVLWGFGVTLSEVSTIGCARSFLSVILCPSDSHPTQRIRSPLLIMNTVQVTINGNLVEGEVALIQAILGQNTNILTSPVTNTNFQDIEEFDVFMTAILKEYFSEQQSESIVTTLSQISQEKYPDYRGGLGLYQMFVGTLEQRQLLKVVFATYALKFGRNHDHKSSLKSKIKYATACPHCGAYASAIRDRLIKEGFLAI